MGETLKVNTGLLLLDLSENDEFDNDSTYHGELIESLMDSSTSKLARVNITTLSLDIKAHYLDLIEYKPSIAVYVDNKMLEDVDI